MNSVLVLEANHRGACIAKKILILTIDVMITRKFYFAAKNNLLSNRCVALANCCICMEIFLIIYIYLTPSRLASCEATPPQISIEILLKGHRFFRIVTNEQKRRKNDFSFGDSYYIAYIMTHQ